MTGAELAVLVNGLLSATSMVLRWQASHAETPEAERARLLRLAEELEAEGSAMDRWRPLPPPGAPGG